MMHLAMLLLLNLLPGGPGEPPAEVDDEGILCAVGFEVRDRSGNREKLDGAGLIECEDGSVAPVSVRLRLGESRLRRGEAVAFLGTFNRVEKAPALMGQYVMLGPAQGPGGGWSLGHERKPVGLAMIVGDGSHEEVLSIRGLRLAAVPRRAGLAPADPRVLRQTRMRGVSPPVRPGSQYRQKQHDGSRR